MTDGEPELDTRPIALDRLHGLASEPPRRPDRFDRPPEPHDWRWVVGGVGRTFIAVGVLMFAFVAYQLWGTGIQTAAAQDRLAREFDELLAAQSTASSSVPDISTLPTVVGATVVGTTVVGTTVPDTSVGAAPAPDVAAPTTVAPATIGPPAEGEPLARLEIDSIDLDWQVIEGVRTDDLANGPGHFPETPMPGQLGNAALAGHRTTHGAPFGRIADIEVGNQIVVTTLAGRFVYVVTGALIVTPDEYSKVIPTIDPGKAMLTLTSCHPKWSTQKRYVVQADLDPTLSSPVTAPADDLPPPSDDQPAEVSLVPTTSDANTDATIGTGDTAVAVPATEAPGATTIDNATTSVATSATADAAASEDVFQNSWFADDGAWSQVALWGLGLIVVAIGAWSVSRRTRRNWMGALVGIVPFVVVLYFWFENVNRLLPANL